MATKAVFSAKAGLLLYFLFRGLPVLSAVKVGSDYSDAVFGCSSSRPVLRGGILHGRMLLAGLRHKCKALFGIHVWRSYPFLPIILLLLGYSRSTLSNLRSRTDAVLFTNLARLFLSIRFTQSLWVVLSYIFPLYRKRERGVMNEN